MRKRNIVVWLCAVTAAASLAAGCGQKEEGSAQATSAAQEAEVSQNGTKASDPKMPELREGARIVRVTEITENTITAEEGMFQRPPFPEDPGEGSGTAPGADGAPGGGGAPGEGKAGYGENNTKNREGERQFEDGERPEGGMHGGFGGGSFEGSGETVTFQVTDSTEILLGSPQGSQQGTIEDISVGSVLEIVLDSQDQAEQIIINNMGSRGGMPSETIEETEL